MYNLVQEVQKILQKKEIKLYGMSQGKLEQIGRECRDKRIKDVAEAIERLKKIDAIRKGFGWEDWRALEKSLH